MSVKRVSVALLCSLMALGAVACGGGGGEGVAEGSATRDGASGAVNDIVAGVGGLNDECLDAARAFASLAAIPALMMGGRSDELAEIEQELAGLGGKIPAELQDAFEVIEPVLDEYVQLFDGFSYDQLLTDPSAMARFEEASELFSDPEVEAAFEEMSTYFETNCEG
jgi:hypothetical protein